MQNTKRVIAILAVSVLIFGAPVRFERQEASADVQPGFRVIENAPGRNATTTISAADGQSIASSTVSSLRFVANGATSTIPTASTTALSNQNGFNVADAASVHLAYKTVGSSSPYTMKIDVEYGYDIPLPNDSRKTSIEWFRYNLPVTGPLSGAGYNALAATTTGGFHVSQLATATPMIVREQLGIATTSEVIEIPTRNAKYMRIHAAAYGSSAMFWLNAIIKDYRR